MQNEKSEKQNLIDKILQYKAINGLVLIEFLKRGIVTRVGEHFMKDWRWTEERLIHYSVEDLMDILDEINEEGR